MPYYLYKKNITPFKDEFLASSLLQCVIAKHSHLLNVFFFIFIYFLLTYCSNPAMAFHKLGSKFRARKISGCDWMSESGVWTLQVREAGE